MQIQIISRKVFSLVVKMANIGSRQSDYVKEDCSTSKLHALFFAQGPRKIYGLYRAGAIWKLYSQNVHAQYKQGSAV